MDLGTGAGTAALFLAQQGFDSTGFDVSSTAINMAKKNAQALNLKAHFQVQDLNSWDPTESYDLIVDSSFLHCIVYDEEREMILKKIKQSLTADGYFFLHTMIQADDMSDMLERDYLFLEEEVLWSTGSDSWEMDWKDYQGKRVFPHRRIKSLDSLEEEIKNNDF